MKTLKEQMVTGPLTCNKQNHYIYHKQMNPKYIDEKILYLKNRKCAADDQKNVKISY
jgi:hypothetical protein